MIAWNFLKDLFLRSFDCSDSVVLFVFHFIIVQNTDRFSARSNHEETPQTTTLLHSVGEFGNVPRTAQSFKLRCPSV
jgi:hypothetical protein